VRWEAHSPKTVTNHLLVLPLVFKRAVRLRLITRNPVLDVERPRVEQSEMSVLSEVEIARLLTLAITNAWRRRFCTQATAAAASDSWLSAGLPELGRPRRKMGRAASGHLTPTPSGPFTPADSGGGVISLTHAHVNPAVDARVGRANGVNTPHPTHREDSSAYAVTSAWDLH